MIRFIVIAAILCLACRWIFGRWPWDYLSAPPNRSQTVFRARKLLGVSADADRAQIIEAHKRLANAARDALIDSLPENERSL